MHFYDIKYWFSHKSIPNTILFYFESKFAGPQVPQGWKKQLKAAGWHKRQIEAMIPYAAFQAARVLSDWQASATCLSEEDAAITSNWQNLDLSW